MAYDQTTARVDHEFSTGWIEQNPMLAADRIMVCIRELQDSEMEIDFDFSRHGFVTITGKR
jgi:hypothetical protein